MGVLASTGLAEMFGWYRLQIVFTRVDLKLSHAPRGTQTSRMGLMWLPYTAGVGTGVFGVQLEVGEVGPGGQEAHTSRHAAKKSWGSSV